jgi:hypothetical protein
MLQLLIVLLGSSREPVGHDEGVVSLVLKLMRTVVLVEFLEDRLALETDGPDFLRLRMAQLQKLERAASIMLSLQL